MERMFLFLFSLILVHLHVHITYAAELTTITNSNFLTDGDTLVSPGGVFELGFFYPNSSQTKFVGIWYKKISIRFRAVVWVANRNYPRPRSSVNVLRISDRGNLVLVRESSNEIIWSSSNDTSGSSGNATARLLDSGNLVVMDKDRKVLWQSFDHPTDTILPGMKLGKDYARNIEWNLTSWESSQDPAPGDYTWSANTRSYPQNVMKRLGVEIFRAPPWSKERLVGNVTFTFNVVIIETEESLEFTLENNTIMMTTRVILNSNGQLESLIWVEDEGKWETTLSLPRDRCDTYNICSAYGSCSIDNVTDYSCACIDKIRFIPRNERTTDGCVRRRSLNCNNGQSDDGFVKYSNVKLPDTQSSWFNTSMSLVECETRCLNNCSCMAYANIETNSGCLIWSNDLIDIRVNPQGRGGRDIFVRMASSDLVADISKEKRGTNIRVILLSIFPVVLVIAIISLWCLYARIKRNRARFIEEGGLLNSSRRHDETMELPLLSFTTVANATASFSLANKLGEGGFGPVYKGVLEGGIEVAVKRLSKTSAQGVNEFKNEVICISKLQHRNLVKLLGCCIQGDEKLLVYEYMPNRSLDSFLFDNTKSMLLDWQKRFNIIMGIARGLVYLHQDSRLRIIHRDLKASNILLDEDMNPKISDFGVARSFGGNQTQANTERIVGTYGYMSPEYALDGVFSIKSDVFSFGVLILEIVNGKRNRGFILSENDNNLVGHAWILYNEGRSMQLIDASLVESCHPPEVLRSIEVALLCVQHNPADRPNMSDVIRMLGGEGTVPQPKEPVFFTEKDDQWLVAEFSSSTCPANTDNHIAITELVGR